MRHIARYDMMEISDEMTDAEQGLGAAQDAARMQRVVSFYEKLPRGAAPELKPKGPLARYQARYFGKNPSATRMSKPRMITELCSNEETQLSSMPSFSSSVLVMLRTTTFISVSSQTTALGIGS